MTKARKEGSLSIAAKPGPKAKSVSEGVKHARALDAAIDYWKANMPEDAEEAKNWPFSSTIERVIAQLNNL